MKYEWKLPEQGPAADVVRGQEVEIDPDAKVVFRRRREEIPL